MEKLQYTGCCVHLNGEDINDMKDRAIDITYQTLAKHVDREELNTMIECLGYDTGPGRRGGLRVHDDYAVSFHRSKYRGRRCYYIAHSGIEYIFS